MKLNETTQGIEVIAPDYRLLMDRVGGFAIREVEIKGEGRLDRFDRVGEGPHPTCMYFDNLTVNMEFQLGHYGKINDRVTAGVDAENSSVEIDGKLIPIIDGTQGEVRVSKTLSFSERYYDVDLDIEFVETGPIHFLSVWWDVHDKWLRTMSSGTGMYLPLRVGIGDAFGEVLHQTWCPAREMDQGAGVWMAMNGEKVSILTALRSPAPTNLSAGGMKFWDGPDDADEGEGVSHGCINLDLINSELSRTAPQEMHRFRASYRVFLSAPSDFRNR